MYSDTSREDGWVARLLELTRANALQWKETDRLPVELRNLSAATKLGFVATVPSRDPNASEDFKVRIFLAKAATTDVYRMEVHTYAHKFDVYPSPEILYELLQTVSKQVFRYESKVIPDDPEAQFEAALGL